MSNPTDPTPLHDTALSNGVSNGVSNGLSRSVVVSDRPVVSPLSSELPSQGYQYATEEEQFNVRKFTALILRRWRLMATIFGSIMLLALLASLLTPKVYRATAQVIINSDSGKNNPLSGAVPPALTSLLSGANGRSQDTEIQILQSQPVLAAATAQLPANLRNGKMVGLDVRTVGTTDIVAVSVNSTNPTYARMFANNLCSSYVRQSLVESNKQYAESAKFVSGQLADIKRKMDGAGTALMEYKQANGITDLAGDTAARIERMKNLMAGLQTATVERDAGVKELQTLLSSTSSTPKSEIAPNIIAVRPVVQQNEQQLTSLQNQLSALRGEFQPGSPEIRALEDQIRRLKQQIASQPRTQVQQYTRNINPVRQSLDQSIVQQRAQNDANNSRIATFQTQLAEAKQELQSMPLREKNLTQLTMSLQGYQTAWASLNDKLGQLQISQAAPVANSKLLSYAAGASQTKPNVKMNLFSGFFAAAFFALMGAMLVDRMDNRIHSEDDVREATQLPVLAFIPKVQHFETESLVAIASRGLDTPHTPLLESYRMLRTGLMFTVLDSPLRCIMLTSSQPNEGKSSVAANLATVLAMNGKTVLLIDSDLRRPSAQRLFNLSSERGFSTVAAGLCTLEEAIQPTNVEGLSVLTVGPTPPNPPEMLDSRAARMIFKNARALADFVIIDAPPALMMADAQIIAPEADGILLVVSWEEALKNAVSKTAELLNRTGVKVMGVVVNKWDDKSANYSKYYEHYALHPASEDSKK